MKRFYKGPRPLTPFSQSNQGTPVFNGTGPGEWVMVKDRIIAEFKSNNCWDYVDPDKGRTAMEEGEQPDPDEVIVEAQVDGETPDVETMVNQNLEDFDNNVLVWYNKVKAQAALTLDDDERETVIQKIEREKSEKEFKKFEMEHLFKYRFEEAKRRHVDKVKEHVEKIAKTLKVFHQFFKARPLAIILNDLEKARFRNAWAKLDEVFLTREAESTIKMMAIEGLQSLKYDESKGLEVCVKDFNKLWDKTGSEDEYAKVGYFKQCLEKSRTNPFKETMSLLHLQGFVNYSDIVEVLYRKEMEHRSKRDYRQMISTDQRESAMLATSDNPGGKKAKVSQQQAHAALVNAVGNGKPKAKCTHCGMDGHSRATCWDIVACTLCGFTGHAAWGCKQGRGNRGAVAAVAAEPNRSSNRTATRGGGTGLGAPKVKDTFIKKRLFKAKVT